MPIPHLLLALLVVIVWGLNFIFVKWALHDFSPMLLCASRFLLASIPAIFFIKKPAAPFKIVVSYGLIMFALQFFFIFCGMHAGITPGLASILLQLQVFFSIAFAALFLRERPRAWQIIGAIIAFQGILIIGIHAYTSISLLGFIFIVLGAAAWGFGTLITKKVPHINVISLVVWGSFAASIPMIIICLVLEGPAKILMTLSHVSKLSAWSLAYIVYASTWIGYGVWNWLVSRHQVSTVAPYALLVPIVGLLSSILIDGEPLEDWKLLAALLVILGLSVNILGPRLFRMLNRRRIVNDLSSDEIKVGE